MAITFSIIIPTYNRAQYLPRAINSIFRQTYTDYELIVIDDGSTDNTQSVLTQHEHLPLKIITLAENQGVAAARNEGIKVAKGKYIAFLDSDDEWRSDYLYSMAIALDHKEESVLAYSHYQSVLPAAQQIEEVKTFPQQQDLVTAMLLDNFIHTMSSVVIPARVFDRVGLFNEDLLNCSDREFYLRAFTIGKPVVVPMALVRKHWQRDSLTVKDNSQQWLNNGLKLLDIFYGQASNSKYLPLREIAESSLRQRVKSSSLSFSQQRSGTLARGNLAVSDPQLAPVKVSLHIVNYNRAKYLAAAIESVLNQTYPHFELIIWDDGSTDRSLAIAHKYEQLDSRIKVHSDSNQGFTLSLAAAIATSNGAYLGWVDSDDLLHPFALATTVNRLNAQPDVGMVYTDRLIIDESGKTLGLDERCSMPYSSNSLLLNFMTFHFRLMRRTVYEEVGGIDGSFTTAQDYDLCLKLSEVTLIRHIRGPLYFYRQHPQSISQAREFEQVACTQRAISSALVRRGLAPSTKLKLRLKPQFSLQSNEIQTQQLPPKTENLSPLPNRIQDHQLISIVVTVYNRQEYLATTIDSIIAQTYPHFELIIWDDGSTDRSLAIAHEYEQLDSRIKVFTEQNEGQPKALVKAIAKAQGKYLGTVDSDDLLHPFALSKTFSILESDSEVGMVYTDHVVIDSSGKHRGAGKRCQIPYSKERLLIDFMTFHFRLMRRDVYDSVGGIDPSLSSAEDYDLCLRLSEMTKIEHISEPLYYYRWHSQNLSTTQQLKQVKYSTIAINKAIARRGQSQKLQLKVQLNPSYQLTRQTKVANKVFGIGLSKTGTTSLTNALNLLGIPSVHLPHSIEQIQEFDGATDTPIVLAYKKLDRVYPGSKFILTIRSPKSWLNSFISHRERILKIFDGRVSSWIRDLDTRCYGQWEYDPAVWLSAYNRHLNGVMEYFHGRESDLLILNICDGQGWSELCPFLGCAVPNVPFPHENRFAKL